MSWQDYEAPRFVNEGMRVAAPFETGHPDARPGLAVWCTVVVAAGVHARVVSERYGYDRWQHIDDLRVPIAKGGAP